MSRDKITPVVFLFVGLLLLSIPKMAVAQAKTDISSRHSSSEGTLQLTTSIANEQYCFDGYSPRLQFTLRLNFTNMGRTPILLDKNSSWIVGSLVSRSLKDAEARKYVSDATYSYNLSRILREGLPDKSSFVTLEPNESYSLDTDLGQLVYDGTKDSSDNLHPGDYVLQIKVGTWLYGVPSEAYRVQWREQGFLWSRTTTSQPMPFTVVKPGVVSRCPSTK